MFYSVGGNFYTERDLKDCNFKSLGKNVRIAKNCTIIGVENIKIGNNVRIDNYCTLVAPGNGYISLGSYIHIASYCFLLAPHGIIMEDFSSISTAVQIYTNTDDYSGEYLTNPTIPKKYSAPNLSGEVLLKRHVIIGSGTVILPNVVIGEGVAIGALSLVKKSLEEWGVYAGVPVKKIISRSKNLLCLEAELLSDIAKL